MRRDNNPRRDEMAVLAAIGPERATLSQYLNRLSLFVTEGEARASLGPDRWAQAYAAGRKSSIDTLIQDIDRAQS